MSNLGPYGGAKNAPWTRSGNTNSNLVGQTSSLQQQIMNQSGINNMDSTGIVPFQQQQVLTNNMLNNMSMQQQNLGLSLQQMTNPVSLGSQLATNQLFQQVGSVTYPNPRALNATAFQNPSLPSVPQTQTTNNSSPKPRVFTGTVTTVHDNFGFVDEDVFFQTAACVKGSNPIVGDRVLVEASYNSRMPFKWIATRIQVLPTSNQAAPSRNSKNFNTNQSTNSYNAVPPPNENGNYGRNRAKANVGGRGRERSRDKERDDDDMERKKRREDRMREREKEDKKSPLRRNRSRSPKSRRRSRIVPRYMVQIPKIALDLMSADVLETRHRYSNLYIPSDFFCSQFRWMDAFPADKPFTLNKSCLFHIMHKDVDPVIENDAVLEPPDADYLFSAKVMLMSVPGMEEMYQKCCAMAEDKDRRDRDSEERDYVHPTRLVNFLVGLRGKNETMAIGGPWSPSLDGENPDKDPSVLIKTAIRTCKALTGIDLSNCTKWYRFVELYYRRGDSSHKGKPVAARVETVVLFLPDVWSCLATRLEWDSLQLNYNSQLERKLKADQETDEPSVIDEKEEEPATDKVEPTHHTQLDPKNMTVIQMRKELEARNINSNGIKSQLCAKLTKALKSEAAKSEDTAKEDTEQNENADDKKAEVDEKKLDEKERQLSEKRYTLPDQQHVIVHPSRTAKSGKFDCTVMSLSLLLDYRPEDTKEHSFEVSLFAELFNEMLMRDFGFNIYKALCELPEKPKEKDDKKKKEDDKKADDKKKEDDKKDDEKKKDDKKEDKEKKSEDRKSVDKKGDKKDKKEEKKSDSEDDVYEEDEDKDKKKEKDKKKRERPKMFTKDRNLLLSFIYFDQTHCGYIFEKDIEDLLYTLGLNLSRAQVRKLVGKVITRDSLHYRKLTDKPKDEGFIVIDDSERECNLEELANGNKTLLPIFSVGGPPSKKLKFDASNDDNKTNEIKDGLIMFGGGLVDIEKLMAQLERSDKARLDTEARMIDLKSENSKLIEKNTKSTTTIKSLSSELKDYKEKLKITEESLHRITACSKLFQTTLVEIRDKIDPVLNSTLSKEDIKKEETKTRWEKDTKEAACKTELIEIDCNEEKSDVK